MLLLTVYPPLVPALLRVGTAPGNLVSGISLVLHKPVRRGDRLQVQAPAGLEVGEVEDVSLGYTVLRTDDQRRIVIAGSTMTQQTMVKLADAASEKPTS